MAEVVVGTYRPKPGQSLDTFELPGPGTYEADFEMPAIVAETLLGKGWEDPGVERSFTVNAGGKEVEHVKTFIDPAKKRIRAGTFDIHVLTVRFKIIRDEPRYEGQLEEAGMGAVFAAILRVLLGALATAFIAALAKALVEVRKIIEASPAIAGGGALALAGLGLFLVIKAR